MILSFVRMFYRAPVKTSFCEAFYLNKDMLLAFNFSKELTG
jgi:hypothetical protein